MKKQFFKHIIAVFSTVFIFVFLSPSIARAEHPTPILDEYERNIKTVLNNNIPASVYIEVGDHMGSGFIIEFTELYVYIVTNRHVTMCSPKDIKVVFYEGGRVPAILHYESTAMDMAVVRVEKKDVPDRILKKLMHVVIAESKAEVGNAVGIIARHTDGRLFVSDGEVLALDFECLFDDGVIENGTIASYPSQSGTSGSAVYNDSGYVVGMNTGSVYSGYGIAGAHYAFFLPIEEIEEYYNMMRNRSKKMETLIRRSK